MELLLALIGVLFIIAVTWVAVAAAGTWGRRRQAAREERQSGHRRSMEARALWVVHRGANDDVTRIEVRHECHPRRGAPVVFETALIAEIVNDGPEWVSQVVAATEEAERRAAALNGVAALRKE